MRCAVTRRTLQVLLSRYDKAGIGSTKNDCVWLVVGIGCDKGANVHRWLRCGSLPTRLRATNVRRGLCFPPRSDDQGVCLLRVTWSHKLCCSSGKCVLRSIVKVGCKHKQVSSAPRRRCRFRCARRAARTSMITACSFADFHPTATDSGTKQCFLRGRLSTSIPIKVEKNKVEI
jgi:hypothetical protein